MRVIGYLFLLVIVLLGITFSTLNANVVTVNYYIGRSALPLSLLLVLTFSLGCILGMLVGVWLLMKTKLKNYQLKHQLTLAEKEVKNLRVIPLRDQ
ncbi:MAG: hypothetical protein A3E83_08305 [Gammaproteobacteria bacterium RIFCSPHIGHO2_12_FULL_41_20]|nr:MAG: hypothetical protein A3E83_08305 [Gammaproteobacteria bacterium RIFCSPHIGHO2_12_FULL_41_20]